MAFHLITGGAGFVGSHIARRLIEQGERVRVFDIKRTDKVPEGAEMFIGDMRDRRDVRHACRGIDVVYHLAFIEAASREIASRRWNINFKGTKNFIENSLDAGVKRFVLVSTTEVYNSRQRCPYTESALTDKPLGWYGHHKQVVERLAREYVETEDFPVVILRFPTICGPGYYARRHLLDLLDWVALGLPLVWVDGEEKFADFVHIEDVLQGLLLAGRAPAEANGEVFNISCSKPAAAPKLMEACARAVNSNTRVFLLPREQAIAALKVIIQLGILEIPMDYLDYMFYDNYYSSDKAKRILGYEPQFSAEQAVVELFRSYLANRDEMRSKAKNY